MAWDVNCHVFTCSLAVNTFEYTTHRPTCDDAGSMYSNVFKTVGSLADSEYTKDSRSMPSNNSRYGEWTQLRFAREQTGLTRPSAAALAGLSRQHYFNLEVGHRWPTVVATQRLADALRVPLSRIARPTEGRKAS